jgi:tyrosyl-tRNA synthetase
MAADVNVYDVLEERGFIQQCSDPEALRALLGRERVTCYVGFDPTATSLHVGSLVPIMALAHMQRHGHRPIAIVGGGTGMVGDPSGKTEMRKLLGEKEILENMAGLRAQLSRYITFEDGKALMLNNADWLLPLNYIRFLREIGRHFSVNRMLAAEAYRQRMEKGLSFLEFNYQILQAYDFLYLYQNHDCVLQMGGDDQWGNILAGVELIRRVTGGVAYALTFPLLTTASGQKMGKTASGAIWLDAERLSPHEFYQYWRNTDDRDVERFLGLFTFLPMEEVRELGRLEGAELNRAKERLAYEVTRLAHGEAAAREAQEAARALFGAAGARDSDAIPTVAYSRDALAAGVSLLELFPKLGLTRSRGETRRLILHGGAYVNDVRVNDIAATVGLDDLEEGRILVRAGKKRYARVVLES